MRKEAQQKKEAILDYIRQLADVPSYYKHNQLVQGIINAIDDKVIEKGERLPSVNTMIEQLHFSRATIVKGIAELIDRGVIGSQKRLGYYVLGGEDEKIQSIALVMYNLDTFEEQFYRNFRAQLSKKIRLDVFFHHGNIETFEKITEQIKGGYEMNVIAPIPHPKSKALLEQIPRSKFLMVDRYEQIEGQFNHITQEFKDSTYRILSELAPPIKKFEEIIFFHNPDSLDPKEMVGAFKKFLVDFKIKGRILSQYIPHSAEKGKVYFTLDNFLLWEIMKDVKAKNLAFGKDVGLLSSNDEPAKEFIGITTFSTDFSEMGTLAGKAALSREKISLTLPMKLKRRMTL